MMFINVSKLPKMPFFPVGNAVSIAGLSDQTGTKYLLFREGKNHALATLADHLDRAPKFLSNLSKSGIIMPGHSARANIDRGIGFLKDWPELLYVAETSGMHHGAYVKPDGIFLGTRRDFWDAKLRGNRERDARNSAALAQAGWRVATVWECALVGRTRWEQADIVSAIEHWLAHEEADLTVSGLWQD